LLTQWNSAQEELNFNFRLQYIPKIGTDFFLIFNQLFSSTNQQLKPTRNTLIGKLIWRFVL